MLIHFLDLLISFSCVAAMANFVLMLAVILALLSMEILAASLNSPKALEETPAEERTFGFLALLAIWPAIKGFFTKLFVPATTY